MAVNDIYGVDLLLCSTNAFIMVVAKLFRIYMSAAEHKSGFIFLNNVIWMIYGGQFIVMCWVCTLTHREINKIGLYISEFVLNTRHNTKFTKLAYFRNFRNKEPEPLEIFNGRGDNGVLNLNGFGMESLLRSNFERDCVRNEMNDFSLQLQHHRVMFTACDFFEMDNSLLTRFISVITTYLIILVQFYKPEGF
ncbi:Putative gustatory receptor 2a [Habropoda laboriosa]|uniref:Putative gustatory receptor 2a n=2 Tax=Habropoda laboriosa TaxID=597456 RepID=A0A0L7QVG9_9HYME|nr:Putative gustatory receptor 2a [Habropoda laboriosa]